MEMVSRGSLPQLRALRTEIDRLWNRFFGETDFPGASLESYWPPVDVSETKNNLVIKANLPGIEPKDIVVTISGDLLTLKGDKAKEQEGPGEHHYYRCERYSGPFKRSFSLPLKVQAKKVKVTLDKGVLKITLPKTEEAKKKEIKVQVE